VNALRTAATVIGLGILATAQDDLRDVVRLKNGKELRGRVVAVYEPVEILIVQGGRRLRAKREQIAEMRLVSDRVREFLDRRLRMRDQPRAQWILVEWAQSKKLVNLARLQAMQVVLATGDERAHEFLGHRKRRGEWQWPHRDSWYSIDVLQQQIVRSPMTLSGERFRLQCQSDLRTNIDALFDLERMGVWWYDNFGEDLGLLETLQPVDVLAMRDASQFQKWGFRPVPYYVPSPLGDQVRTFYAGPNPKRPRLLFYCGAQGLLYRSLIGSFSAANNRDRVCPWLEVGLPMLAEQVFAGEPGYALPGKPRMKDLEPLGRDYRLTHLLHLPMYGGFYLMDDAPTNVNWSAATMFVQYLLQDDNQPQTRSAFFSYVQAALADRKGDSSSLFDHVMGRRIENFEQPFRAWLEKVGKL